MARTWRNYWKERSSEKEQYARLRYRCFFTSILRSSRNIAKNLQLPYPCVYLSNSNRITYLSLPTAVRKLNIINQLREKSQRLTGFHMKTIDNLWSFITREWLTHLRDILRQSRCASGLFSNYFGSNLIKFNWYLASQVNRILSPVKYEKESECMKCETFL